MTQSESEQTKSKKKVHKVWALISNRTGSLDGVQIIRPNAGWKEIQERSNRHYEAATLTIDPPKGKRP